jgi:predicted outer membrane repeat protein
VSATTWYVKPDSSGDAINIQAAIDLASQQDTILLSDGVFTGNGNRDISLYRLAVVIRSENGDPETCVIDLEGSSTNTHYGFNIVSNRPNGVFMEGFTIRNGYMITDGSAIRWGSGSYPLTIRNCVFETNYAPIAGAVDCNLSGIGSLSLIGCKFIGNSSEHEGGAMRLRELDNVVIEDCYFYGNTGSSSGGISMRECVNTSISHCTFENNHAVGTSGWGGGIQYKINSTGTVRYCLFIENSATFGGAISADESSPIIENCTFYNNQASTAGPCVEAVQCTLLVSKSILAFNANGGAAYCGGGGIITFDNSDIFGNTGGDWTGCIAGQLGINGNISEDPLFCDAALEDFYLHIYSPCIPINNPSSVLMGAFEQRCPSPIGIAGHWQLQNQAELVNVYPNPFNPVTNIDYSLPFRGFVRLVIFDVRGRQIKVLAEGDQEAGKYTRLWSGRDDNGSAVSFGVYFVRLEFDGENKTRKLIILK